MKCNKPNFKIKTLFFAITFAAAALSGCGGSFYVATLPGSSTSCKMGSTRISKFRSQGTYLSVVKNSDSYDIYSNFNGSDNTSSS